MQRCFPQRSGELTIPQVLLAVMSGAFGLAGFYFGNSLQPVTGTISSIDNIPGRKPTSATSETKVSIVPGSLPWQTDSTKGDEAREHFKYQYG
jgi:hypothetical protein